MADFGESKTNDGSGGGDGDTKKELFTMTLVGTHQYMAPEVLEGQKYNKSVDVFSFALTLLEIALGDAGK